MQRTTETITKILFRFLHAFGDIGAKLLGYSVWPGVSVELACVEVREAEILIVTFHSLVATVAILVNQSRDKLRCECYNSSLKR